MTVEWTARCQTLLFLLNNNNLCFVIYMCDDEMYSQFFFSCILLTDQIMLYYDLVVADQKSNMQQCVLNNKSCSFNDFHAKIKLKS